MERADVIVIGCGAVGAASALQVASRGASVIAIDQFEPPHEFGSSHGDTRITRLSVGEGASYVPLVARSHEIWRELESVTGRELLVACGGLVMGVPGASGQHGVADFVGATIEIARHAGIEHDELDTAALAARFPMCSLSNEIGYFEPSAGYLRAEDCVRSTYEVARQRGATLAFNERVVAWSAGETGVRVATNRTQYEADQLVVAAGSWVGDLLGHTGGIFRVHRQVLYWFDIATNYEALAAMPVFIWMHGTAPGQFVYGFPAIDGPRGGVKIAAEDYSAETTASQVAREVTREESARMYEENVAGLFGDLRASVVRTATCVYTVTPDAGFVIDRHPEHDNVLIASPCSGHGFKHSAAVGELVAQMALGETPFVDPSPFSFARFAQ